MTRRLFVYLLALLLPLMPLVARGEGVIPITPGDPAPADGYFVPRAYLEEALAQSAALRAALDTLELEKTNLREQMRLGLETEEQKRQIAVEAEKEKARIEIEALKEAVTRRDQVIAEKDQTIYKLEHPPWYTRVLNSPITGIVLAIAIKFAF